MAIKEKAIEALKGVMDPHVGLNVWDMGLVHDLEFDGSEVTLVFIPTSPFCPLGIELAYCIKKALNDMDEIDKVNITIKGHLDEKKINELLCKDD